MSDLKLPLEVGKWYRRADGKYAKSIDVVTSWGVAYHSVGDNVYEATSGATRYPAPVGSALIAGPFDAGLTLPLVAGRWYVLPDGTQHQAENAGTTNRWTPGVRVNELVYETATGECCATEPRAAAKYALRDLSAPAASVGHPHAAAMLEYAKDAATHAEPWLLWEFARHGNEWGSVKHHPAWDKRCQYRRRPCAIRIGEHDVPEPLREATEGQEVYVLPALLSPNAPCCIKFRPAMHGDWLRRGLLFATAENAEAAARAVIAALGGEV